MIIIYLLLLVGFSALLIKSTDILTDSLTELSKITKMGKFAITSFLLAFATSIPELVVGITASLEGRPSLALGAILGSNIANISLVIGGATVIGGTLGVAGDFFKIDIFSVFLAGVLPIMLLMDGDLSRVDGIILLFIYGMYNYGLLSKKRRYKSQPSRIVKKFLQNAINKRANRWLAWLFLGAAMLMFSADMIVKVGGGLAQMMGVPVFLVGLFLVAVGTSLPELSFEIRAIKKKQAGMALGDLFGSIVANSTLVLGLVSLISPIKLENGLDEYLLASATFGIIFLLFWYFVKTKKKLERWEGVILLIAYVVFIMAEFWGK
ncbi:MAG: sodium:calcium antiporter [Patescibacteria group bacterium]|nr:sodium:calcium antiporter [Patescibacteria group bacterium]